MSGSAVIWYFLKTDAAVLAQVPEDRIKCGDLPVGITLPAISVMEISGNRRRTVAMRKTVELNYDRVQVTVLAKTYPAAKALLKLVLAACPNTRGTVNTIAVDSILPDSEGPDQSDSAAQIFAGSRDFMVKWHE
jgi:hypothetical protein